MKTIVLFLMFAVFNIFYFNISESCATVPPTESPKPEACQMIFG